MADELIPQTAQPLPVFKPENETGGSGALSGSAYSKARELQRAQEAEDQASKERNDYLLKQGVLKPRTTVIGQSVGWGSNWPTRSYGTTPNSEEITHPEAAALEAKHASEGITNPADRVKQFSLMYGGVTGAHAQKAMKEHAELLTNTLKSIQEANIRGGVNRTPAIHTNAIRGAEHAIWKNAQKASDAAPVQSSFDLEESNRAAQAATEKRVASIKEEIRPLFNKTAAKYPNAHPLEVGTATQHELQMGMKGSFTRDHASAVQSLAKELHDNSLEEMSIRDSSGKLKLDTSHPRHAAITSAVARENSKPKIKVYQEDNAEEPETPAPAAPAKAPRGIPKSHIMRAAQNLVYQHWVKDNPVQLPIRGVDKDAHSLAVSQAHSSHYAGFLKTDEAKHPLLYLKHKMGIVNPEEHVTHMLSVKNRVASKAFAPEKPAAAPLDMGSMPDIEGRRAAVQQFVNAPTSAVKMPSRRNQAFQEGGAGR